MEESSSQINETAVLDINNKSVDDAAESSTTKTKQVDIIREIEQKKLDDEHD